MARESTRMWCVAKSRVAMRDAPYTVPLRWPLTLAREPTAKEVEHVSRVWSRLCRPSMTPRDFKTYYRYLMRSMLTRNLRQGRPLPANRHSHRSRSPCRYHTQCASVVLWRPNGRPQCDDLTY